MMVGCDDCDGGSGDDDCDGGGGEGGCDGGGKGGCDGGSIYECIHASTSGDPLLLPLSGNLCCQAPEHVVASVHLRQVFMMFVIGSFMLQWLLEQHTFGISTSTSPSPSSSPLPSPPPW